MSVCIRQHQRQCEHVGLHSLLYVLVCKVVHDDYDCVCAGVHYVSVLVCAWACVCVCDRQTPCESLNSKEARLDCVNRAL